jgi:3-phenylpropionate/trans-cinnamate dioxygenase ferredoxin reductase subunit
VKTIVVAGAGLAGLSAAAELRRVGWDGRLLIIGGERHRPYRRPPLSKDYLVSETPPPLELQQAEDVDAEWRLGQWATGLDVRRRTLHVAGGEDADFDGLVIATGVSARPMPPHLSHPEVLGLRSLEDAVTLRGRLATSRRVLVLGAGFLGSEIAAAAVLLGKSVTLVERAAQPMLPAVGAQVGHHLADLHRSRGVDLRLDTDVTQLYDGGRAIRVHLADGSVLPADLVVAALGSRPATSWLDDSGLRLDNGVVLDGCGLAAPGITAAGDVARWPHPLLDHELVRVEHYSNSVDQGRLAARALLGSALRDQLAPLPSFWSHQYDWRLQSVGFTGSRFDFRMVDQDTSGRLLGEYRHHGRLVGAIANGRPRDLVRYRQQLQEGSMDSHTTEHAEPAAM